MKQHYGIGDDQWSVLTKSINTMDLLKLIPDFDPSNTGEPLTKVSLMHYLDRHGDFTEGNQKHKRVARAIFNSLPQSDKIDIMKYMQWMEDGDG